MGRWVIAIAADGADYGCGLTPDQPGFHKGSRCGATTKFRDGRKVGTFLKDKRKKKKKRRLERKRLGT
jgi:hypothetical protein